MKIEKNSTANEAGKFKNLFLMVAAMVFALGILMTSVVRTTALTAAKPAAKNLTPTPAVVQIPKPVDYFLAYPGVLPDHMLYSLKMIRDRVWLWLTTDPLKKGQTLLLFADKRLGAGKALIEGGKVDLGVTTLTKGEKYLEQSIAQAILAKSKGRDASLLLENLSRATLKHEEVLLGVREKLDESQKRVIDNLLDYSRRGQEQVKQTLGK